jgi:hypothetical protein
MPFLHFLQGENKLRILTTKGIFTFIFCLLAYYITLSLI